MTTRSKDKNIAIKGTKAESKAYAEYVKMLEEAESDITPRPKQEWILYRRKIQEGRKKKKAK